MEQFLTALTFYYLSKKRDSKLIVQILQIIRERYFNLSVVANVRTQVILLFGDSKDNWGFPVDSNNSRRRNNGDFYLLRRSIS